MPTDVTWPDIETFYDDNPSGHRRRSPEVDFGVWWTWPAGTCGACEAAVVECARCGVGVPDHAGWGRVAVPLSDGPADYQYGHPIRPRCPSCRHDGVTVHQSPQRVTFVVDTGEFIAVRSSDGRVRRLGRVDLSGGTDAFSFAYRLSSLDGRREVARRLAHAVLHGWTERDMRGGLPWVVGRIAQYG